MGAAARLLLALRCAALGWAGCTSRLLAWAGGWLPQPEPVPSSSMVCERCQVPHRALPVHRWPPMLGGAG